MAPAPLTLTLPFISEEEGLGGIYRGAEFPFAITLGDGRGHLSIEGQDTPLTQKWQTKGVKDGEAGTETSLTGGTGAGLVLVNVDCLDNGFARASLHWPKAAPERELIGFCDDWTSLT